ncbi:CCHC-type domain-containing protein [Aphelenchoides bicaudatus]|nr:CCHC-type domain-containing protein [Aphelenchoides bicaudatus]
MPNANYEPLGSNQKVFGGLPSTTNTFNVAPLQQTKFVDAMGKPIEKQISSGACFKCGFAGHLPFQCRNNMPIEINGKILRPLKDEEEDFETPLQKEDRKNREREAKRVKKQLKKMEKKRKKEAKKRKRSSSTSSSNSSSSDHKKSKKRSKKSKKSKKRRRHSSSSSSE